MTGMFLMFGRFWLHSHRSGAPETAHPLWSFGNFLKYLADAAAEASLSTFVQTWCSKAYMAETMAPSHVANTPLSSRCEVKCAKLINALWADRVSQLKAACNTLNIIKHCIRHVVIDLWCMLSYVWVADGRILSLKQSLLEINQWFHNDWLLSRHEEHIQCRWCSWENDWAHQIHSPPRYTGACGKCLGCHTKTRDILCLISHCGCQFSLPG